jgi:transcriptional regulator with XRE-family HTH domain
MVNLAALADRITAFCKLKGVTANKMLEDCGLNKSTMFDLRGGKVPSIEKIALIASYFDISISDLLGDEKTSNPSMSTGHFGLIADKILEEKGLKSLSGEEEENLVKSFKLYLDSLRAFSGND